MTSDNRFALRLRQLRTERGYSQERLAERSGMSTDGVSNLERALSVPGLDSVELLQRGLDVPIWELLDYMGRDPAPDPERRRLEDALLRASRTLNLNVLEVALAQVEALKKLGK
jgi:transcriptional regulator with XRE-family HTH domain